MKHIERVVFDMGSLGYSRPDFDGPGEPIKVKYEVRLLNGNGTWTIVEPGLFTSYRSTLEGGNSKGRGVIHPEYPDMYYGLFAGEYVELSSLELLAMESE